MLTLKDLWSAAARRRTSRHVELRSSLDAMHCDALGASGAADVMKISSPLCGSDEVRGTIDALRSDADEVARACVTSQHLHLDEDREA